ncbi:hypothetical protein OMY_01404 [Enterococcus sulfureus ATCC 49903]|uniref:Uncharacterized protein n=1 Tax=Enterococcus sulfureus ATCC 49903 TaxID=1140003 RepID=S0NQI2_9ENTE|nr:hypothetical protein [Enterococcus sulfureus]EOT47151.1 hypothetical protein OMY_01404 [Enterococcus sulfureus ATCC 49903]EOT83554.1 hypothetical protein I573_01276 [Enterococcus sulfureus ATCC 49903]
MQEKTIKELVEFLQFSVINLLDGVESRKENSELQMLISNVEDDLSEVKSFVDNKEEK